MAKKAGSLWIEGEELHYVASNGAEWYLKGDYWGGGIGKPGALWIGPDAYLYYLSAAGQRFRIPLENVGPATGSKATPPSLWVEGNNLFHAIGGTKFWNHYAHTDGAGGHTDVPHSDGHTDSTHGDSHTDSHTDSSHGDSHADVAHDDIGHDDGHSDWYTTTSHLDGQTRHTVNPPPSSSHTDDHWDDYASHSGYFHSDVHWDTHTDGPHGDDHSDGSHGDSHNDVAHQDGSHGDGHGDSAHQDGTGAGGHVDMPIYVGP